MYALPEHECLLDLTLSVYFTWTWVFTLPEHDCLLNLTLGVYTTWAWVFIWLNPVCIVLFTLPEPEPECVQSSSSSRSNWPSWTSPSASIMLVLMTPSYGPYLWRCGRRRQRRWTPHITSMTRIHRTQMGAEMMAPSSSEPNLLSDESDFSEDTRHTVHRTEHVWWWS